MDCHRTACEGNVAIHLDAFGGNVAGRVVGTRGRDADFTTIKVTLAITVDALAAGAGIGDGQFSAIHGEGDVGFHARGAGVIHCLTVVCRTAGNRDCRGAPVDTHIIV